MAVTKAKSGLAAHLGAKLDAAVKAHANDKTTYGVVNLPGGIRNGVAQLSKCYFKQFDANTDMKKIDGSKATGEYYLRMEGTVNTPETVTTPDGVVPVKGLTTSIMIPIMDVKNAKGEISTISDQVAKALNEFRKLGGEEFTRGASGEDLEALAIALESAAPYFWFSTSASKPSVEYPNPRVFENWNGGKGLENYQPAEPGTATRDSLPAVPSANGHAAAPSGGQEEESLEDLVSLADSDADSAEVARQRLVDLAIEAGWEEAEVTADDVTWEQVKQMIENPKTEGEGEDAGDAKEPEKVTPKKGETFKYTPPGKTAKNKPYEPRDCQVTAVNDKKETVTLKDLVNKKEYKDVEWSELS